MKVALLSSFLSQAYVSLVGIVLMPVYLRLLGAEGVGLIGLFVMAQALLPLLDLGLSTVLSREMSRFRAGHLDAGEAWLKLRSLVWLFSLIGAIVIMLVAGSRGALASSWLRLGELAGSEVEYCLVAMALAAVLRWVAGIYRSALLGLEEHRWLNVSAFALATIKHVGVLPLLVWGSPTAFAYFSYHAGAGLLELLVLRYAMARSLPIPAAKPALRWSAGLREAWSLAGAMTFLSAVWILFNQVDKLILSRVLSLSDYGYFSLATSLAGGVLVLIPPLAQVLQPRMTILASQGRSDELVQFYRAASQGATALFVAAGGAVAVLAPLLLHAWIGDPDAVRDIAPTLFWYGIASGLVGILALPFMLQFAHGDLGLHVRGNILLCLFGLPALALASIEFGAIGAGMTLCASRLLFLLLWIPFVHRKYIPAASSKWLPGDVLPGAISAIGVLATAACLIPMPDSRLAAAALACAIAALALAAGLLAGRAPRRMFLAWYATER